jgi:protein-S-isoprenylcysteine O-methyltransferase Ste14
MSPVVFTSPVDGAIYVVVYAVWFLSFIGERRMIYSGGGRRATTRSDRGSALIIIGSIFIAVFVADAFARAAVALLPAWSFYLGVVMMVSGIAIRLWAVSTLRSFFSYTVQIKEGHRVVQSGPYRFVRHPAYTGSLLTILGIAFALQSWGAALFMAVTFGITFGYRIRVEEKVLTVSLGEAYASYSKRVKRLIPYVY